MLTKLRIERIKKEIPLWIFAQKLSISPSLLSKIELGRIAPNPEILKRIADALCCDADNLLKSFDESI